MSGFLFYILENRFAYVNRHRDTHNPIRNYNNTEICYLSVFHTQKVQPTFMLPKFNIASSYFIF